MDRTECDSGIIASFGTVAAVIVALHFARRDYIPRLRVSGSIVQTIEQKRSATPSI